MYSLLISNKDFDAEDRLVSWQRGSANKSWDLSLTGNWNVVGLILCRWECYIDVTECRISAVENT